METLLWKLRPHWRKFFHPSFPSIQKTNSLAQVTFNFWFDMLPGYLCLIPWSLSNTLIFNWGSEKYHFIIGRWRVLLLITGSFLNMFFQGGCLPCFRLTRHWEAFQNAETHWKGFRISIYKVVETFLIC